MPSTASCFSIILATTAIEMWITPGSLQSTKGSATAGKVLPLQPNTPPFGSYLKMVFRRPYSDFNLMESDIDVPRLVQASNFDTIDLPCASFASTCSKWSQC